MDDPDPIPLSALQHRAYCPRQCGLIHLEQAFDDNLHAKRGQAVHALIRARVDETAIKLKSTRSIEPHHSSGASNPCKSSALNLTAPAASWPSTPSASAALRACSSSMRSSMLPATTSL